MAQMTDNTALQGELVDLILTSVNLRHKDRSQITSQTSLVGEGLGLDSLDILEIVVAVEKKYGIKISGAEEGTHIFQNIGTLTAFVQTKAGL
jgi:acyl carrier protein